MRLVRTIVSFAVALSVAFAPAAAGVQAHARHVEAAVTASAPAEMLDCDHHRTKPGTIPADDCASLAACAVKCFNYAGTTLPDSAFPPRGPARRPIMVGTVLPLALADSLFRPPRA